MEKTYTLAAIISLFIIAIVGIAKGFDTRILWAVIIAIAGLGGFSLLNHFQNKKK